MAQPKVPLMGQLIDGKDWTRRDADLLAESDTCLRRLGTGPNFDSRVEQIDVSQPFRQPVEARLVQFGVANRCAQAPPLLFRTGADQYPAVIRGVRVPGRADRMSVADTAGAVLNKSLGQERGQRVCSAPKQRNVDVLAETARPPHA